MGSQPMLGGKKPAKAAMQILVAGLNLTSSPTAELRLTVAQGSIPNSDKEITEASQDREDKRLPYNQRTGEKLHHRTPQVLPASLASLPAVIRLRFSRQSDQIRASWRMWQRCVLPPGNFTSTVTSYPSGVAFIAGGMGVLASAFRDNSPSVVAQRPFFSW